MFITIVTSVSLGTIVTCVAVFSLLPQYEYSDIWRKKPTRCHLLFYCTSYSSTCFWHYYANHQELVTTMLITTLVVSIYKDECVSFNVKLCFLVVYVRCEVLCRLVVPGNVFLLILIVLILYAW